MYLRAFSCDTNQTLANTLCEADFVIHIRSLSREVTHDELRFANRAMDFIRDGNCAWLLIYPHSVELRINPFDRSLDSIVRVQAVTSIPNSL